jgi:Flp pilus assembly protein TadD
VTARGSPASPGGWKDVAWIVAAALAIKAVALLELGDHPLLQPQGDLDAERYVELARDVVARGLLAPREPFFVSPLYVYFLAAIFSVGGSLFAARLVQVALGAVAVGFVYLLAREWFGARAGRLAAVLVLLAGFITFSEILILQSALDPILVAASLYCVSRTQTTSGRRPFGAAGLALGLFALNRPNGLAYGFAAAFLIGLSSRPGEARGTLKTWRRPAARVSRVLLPLLAVLTANALLNLKTSGEPTLISSHGGLNFYIGNNAGATGTYHRVPGVAASMSGQVRDAARVAEAAAGRALSSSEVSGHFYAEAAKWIAAQPVEALRLFGRKLAILLNRTDVPLNHSYAFYRRDESDLLRLLVIGPAVLWPLGLVGLSIGAFRAARAPSAPRPAAAYWTWASFVPIYGLSVAAFFVSDRYRMPLFLPLGILAALTLVSVAGWVRERRVAAVAVTAVGIALSAAFVNRDLNLDDGLGGERARKAVALIERGSYDEARRYASTAAEGLPYAGVFHFEVGEALTAAGRYEEAVTELRAALSIDASQPAIHLALGQSLLLAGHSGDAVGHLNAAASAAFRPEVSGTWLARALAADGRRSEAVEVLASLSDAVVQACPAQTQTEMGSLALELEAPAVAERWLRAAAARSPDAAEAHEKLGVALILQGRGRDALAPLEHACRLAPSSASARLNLAVAYAQLGRVVEARSAAREAMRLDPSEPRTAALLRALPPEPR